MTSRSFTVNGCDHPSDLLEVVSDTPSIEVRGFTPPLAASVRCKGCGFYSYVLDTPEPNVKYIESLYKVLDTRGTEAARDYLNELVANGKTNFAAYPLSEKTRAWVFGREWDEPEGTSHV